MIDHLVKVQVFAGVRSPAVFGWILLPRAHWVVCQARLLQPTYPVSVIQD